MRISVTLSEEAADLVTHYAEANGISKGRAVNDLILRSVPRPSRVKLIDGVPILDIPSKGRKLLLKDYKRLQDREDVAQIRKLLNIR